MHACGRPLGFSALGAPRTGALGCRQWQLRGWAGHDRAIGGTVAYLQEGGGRLRLRLQP